MEFLILIIASCIIYPKPHFSLGTSSTPPVPVLRTKGRSCVGNGKHVILATVGELCVAWGISPHLWTLVSPTMKCKDWMSIIFLMTASSNDTSFYDVKQEKVRLERWWQLVGEWQGSVVEGRL